MTFKQKTYARYLEQVNDRISLLQKNLSELSESAQNETKSTAGDKHETALAMLQIEQDNIRRQWKEAIAQKDILEHTAISVPSPSVVRGSLVKTDKGYFFISLALGKLIIDGTTVMAVSPQSPLGARFIGLKKGTVAEWNGLRYTIESIE